MTDRPDDLPRREFLKRAVRAGATLAVTGAAAAALFDNTPPSAGVGVSPVGPPFRDWSLRDDGPRLAIVTGRDRSRTLSRAIDALGGIGRFVRPGDRVLLKPNVGFATPPDLCATTHPDVISVLVRMCLSAGAASVVVTDNPVNDPDTSFRVSGIAQAVESSGGRLILPREPMFRHVSLAGSSLIRDWPVLWTPFQDVDRVIGICPVKDHVRSGATMSLKNWYGLLGGRRNLFHQRISEIVRDLGMLVRPTMVVLDGTVVMRRNGPTGGSLDDLEAANQMIAALDPVAADAYGATLLGRTAGDLPWLAMASAVGCGTADWESLNPLRAVVD